MNIAKISFAATACLGCVLFTACGDMNPVAVKLATSLVNKQDDGLQSNRTPEAVAQKFLIAFANSDFERAVGFCAGNAKVFMETCIASKKMQDPKDYAFWEKEFAAFASARLKDLTLREVKVIEENAKVEVIFGREATTVVNFGGIRPVVIDIAQALFPQNVTDDSESKTRRSEENSKKITLVPVPAKKVVFQMSFDKDSERWMITDIVAYLDEAETEKAKAAEAEKKYDYDSIYEETAAEAEEREKKSSAPAAAPRQDSGMAGDDYGFEMP